MLLQWGISISLVASPYNVINVGFHIFKNMYVHPKEDFFFKKISYVEKVCSFHFNLFNVTFSYVPSSLPYHLSLSFSFLICFRFLIKEIILWFKARFGKVLSRIRNRWRLIHYCTHEKGIGQLYLCSNLPMKAWSSAWERQYYFQVHIF